MGRPCIAMERSSRSPQLEKACAQQEDPAQPKINNFLKSDLNSSILGHSGHNLKNTAGVTPLLL